MAERLHPGVYVEEKRSGLAPIQGVSTSNMGIVGFAERGLSDAATLVTSFPNFEDTFGTFISASQMPTHVFAFFANGGRRAYVVRVTGSGSAKASGYLTSDWAEEAIATGNGVVVAMNSAAPTIGETDIQHTDIAPGEITINFKQTPAAAAVLGDQIGGVAPAMTLYVPTGTPFYAGMVGQTLTIAGATTPANDGSFPITAVSADGKTLTYTNVGGVAEALIGTWLVSVVGEASDLYPVPTGAITEFAGKLGTTSANQPIVPGSVTINDSSAPGQTYTDTNGDGILYEAAAPLVPAGYVDYETGLFSLTASIAPAAPANVTFDYTPQPPDTTVTDDGAGAWNGGYAGAVDYVTGVWSLTTNYAPVNGLPVEAAYTQQVWQFQPISEGVWGNYVRLDVRGDEDYYSRATASFSRYDALVYLSEDLGTSYDLLETFTDLSLTDPTDARYIGSILNNEGIGSSLIDLIEPSNEDVGPRSLSGYQRQRAVGAGDGTQAQFGSSGATPTIPAPFVCAPLEYPIQRGSVSIVYTDLNGVSRTITDDGNGNLIGDVFGGAAAGFNEIDYDTGEFAFETSADGGTTSGAVGNFTQAGNAAVPMVSYYLEPTVLNTADQPTGGLDGAAVTRSELTSPALKGDRKGMYALLSTDELINLTIPDAAGDVTMSVDQVTEAETNEKWFIILATPPGYTPTQAKDWRINTLGITSSYGALYYPYIQIADPVTDLPANVPPGGHIAGVYARTDSAKSVGKAPAGTVDGKLLFATGVERKLEFAEIDILHPNQVNAIINTPQTGLVVWGARTLERPPSDFRYVHVRRLFNFLKASIFNSTHGFVFENVGPPLWSKIRLSVESFLLTQFQQGLFAGGTPAEAFAVICDETNNPQNVQDSGTVICDIYVAPNTPGEFIVFRIQQKVAQAA
jgi:phage tail sheath protein FI